MPKKNIDYSKTKMYKICCRDPTITEIYIGHTTNLTRRRQCHKDNCKNEKKKEYNYKVYEFIRNNGGWDNWSLIPIEEYPCENINQASIRERYWLEELKATLNKNIPSRTIQEYYQNNLDKEKERCKKYRQNNLDKEKERHKKYRQNNLDKEKERYKKYYQNNFEKLKEKFDCECGGKYTYENKSTHLKTKKHQNYLTKTISL